MEGAVAESKTVGTKIEALSSTFSQLNDSFNNLVCFNPTLLWTNPNPTVNTKFEPLTINQPLCKNFDWLIVQVAPWFNTWNTGFYSGGTNQFLQKGNSVLITHINAFDVRNISITDSQIIFANGAYVNNYTGGSLVIDNSRVIPLKVFGVK